MNPNLIIAMCHKRMQEHVGYNDMVMLCREVGIDDAAMVAQSQLAFQRYLHVRIPYGLEIGFSHLSEYE